jgi:hypothetical protein
MEQVLQKREATAAAARTKKTEKEATREQRKAAKEQMDLKKRQRAEARAAAKARKESEKQERLATKDLERRDREAAAVVAQHTREGSACAASESATNNVAWGLMPDPQGLTPDPQQRWGPFFTHAPSLPFAMHMHNQIYAPRPIAPKQSFYQLFRPPPSSAYSHDA